MGEAELVGLLGPNGAGKSTLIKSAGGLVRGHGGHRGVCGAAAGTLRPFGYLAELFRFPGWCTADEVLLLHQRLSGSAGGPAERADLLALVRLDDDRRDVASRRCPRACSSGWGIAQAMIGEPRLLLLDEPTSALDPGGRRTVRDLLAELRRRGSPCCSTPTC